jgi:hypothetical protein
VETSVQSQVVNSSCYRYFEKSIMSFYRRTPVRCERPKGVKNPQEFEPIGSSSWETLRSAQGDMTDGT